MNLLRTNAHRHKVFDDYSMIIICFRMLQNASNCFNLLQNASIPPKRSKTFQNAMKFVQVGWAFDLLLRRCFATRQLEPEGLRTSLFSQSSFLLCVSWRDGDVVVPTFMVVVPTLSCLLPFESNSRSTVVKDLAGPNKSHGDRQ